MSVAEQEYINSNSKNLKTTYCIGFSYGFVFFSCERQRNPKIPVSKKITYLVKMFHVSKSSYGLCHKLSLSIYSPFPFCGTAEWNQRINFQLQQKHIFNCKSLRRDDENVTQGCLSDISRKWISRSEIYELPHSADFCNLLPCSEEM